MNKSLINKALKESSEKMYSTYVDTPWKKAVVFDLDWVLCHLKRESERNNHTGKERSTMFFFNLMVSWFDPLWKEIIILTWRKEKYREITETWLKKVHIPYDKLIMQEWGQAKKNHIYKEEILKELKKEYEIVMLYDDNPDVWEVCERLWIPFQLVEENNVPVDRPC